MRIGYSEEEQWPGQFGMWQANCDRSLAGKRGQAALRELEAALLAMPTKRLIANELVDVTTGDVCAIGALVRYKGITPKTRWPDENMEAVGEECGLPHLVAWKVVEQNDIDNENYTVRAPGPNQYQWPTYQPGYLLRVPVTPEERYEAVLKWVRRELKVAA